MVARKGTTPPWLVLPPHRAVLQYLCSSTLSPRAVTGGLWLGFCTRALEFREYKKTASELGESEVEKEQGMFCVTCPGHHNGYVECTFIAVWPSSCSFAFCTTRKKISCKRCLVSSFVTEQTAHPILGQVFPTHFRTRLSHPQVSFLS